VQDLSRSFCRVSAAKQKTQVAESWSQDAYDRQPKKLLFGEVKRFYPPGLPGSSFGNGDNCQHCCTSTPYRDAQYRLPWTNKISCTYLAHHESNSFKTTVNPYHYYYHYYYRLLSSLILTIQYNKGGLIARVYCWSHVCVFAECLKIHASER